MQTKTPIDAATVARIVGLSASAVTTYYQCAARGGRSREANTNAMAALGCLEGGELRQAGLMARLAAEGDGAYQDFSATVDQLVVEVGCAVESEIEQPATSGGKG